MSFYIYPIAGGLGRLKQYSKTFFVSLAENEASKAFILRKEKIT